VLLRRATFLLALAACGDNVYVPPEEPGTWYGEIGALVRDKCAGCHHTGGVAPFSVELYGEAVEMAGPMGDAIEDGVMPPWYANDPPDCTPTHPWKNNAKLSDDERLKILSWIDAGSPEGTPRELPPIESTSLDNPSIELAPQEFLSTGTTDQFVCFLLDPQIDHVQWLTGSQLTPSNPQLVHHVNVYLMNEADTAWAKNFTGGVGIGRAACEHPPGLAIQSWLPGNPALVLPDTVGIPVPPGTHILTQVHYHPAGDGGTDTTKVELRLTDARPAWRFDLGVYGNIPNAPKLQPGPGDPSSGPAFVIPAFAEDHYERMIIQHLQPTLDLRVLSVTPHMHIIGTHQRVTLKHNDGSEECLIDSGWDFDWQRTYTYDAPLEELPRFDTLSTVDLTCRWNNSFSNPELPRLLYDTGLVAPYDVSLGMTTAHEMCLADFGLLSRY